MPAARFSHVHLGVADLDRSLAFYGKKLGLKVRRIMPTMGSVALEGGSIDLDLVKKPGRPAVTVAFTVPSLKRFYAAIRRRGVKTIDAPTRRAWGAYNFYLRDPDGYTVEVEET